MIDRYNIGNSARSRAVRAGMNNSVRVQGSLRMLFIGV
jgi:hypothetical protein